MGRGRGNDPRSVLLGKRVVRNTDLLNDSERFHLVSLAEAGDYPAFWETLGPIDWKTFKKEKSLIATLFESYSVLAPEKTFDRPRAKELYHKQFMLGIKRFLETGEPIFFNAPYLTTELTPNNLASSYLLKDVMCEDFDILIESIIPTYKRLGSTAITETQFVNHVKSVVFNSTESLRFYGQNIQSVGTWTKELMGLANYPDRKKNPREELEYDIIPAARSNRSRFSRYFRDNYKNLDAVDFSQVIESRTLEMLGHVLACQMVRDSRNFKAKSKDPKRIVQLASGKINNHIMLGRLAIFIENKKEASEYRKFIRENKEALNALPPIAIGGITESLAQNFYDSKSIGALKQAKALIKA